MKRYLLFIGFFLFAIGVVPAQLGETVLATALAPALAAEESQLSVADTFSSEDPSPRYDAATNRRKPRNVHYTAVRNLGGAGATPFSVQLVGFATAQPQLVDERTKPLVRWIHYHSAVLANPPPSIR